MKSAVEVFGEWAVSGRDERMAQGHRLAVEHMLSFALDPNATPFAAIDAGCGNGWVVRMLQSHEQCRQAIGIDGAREMIDKANSLDANGEYVHADLMSWSPNEPVDLVQSMEGVYYFEDPGALVAHMTNHWLKPSGRLIVGLDHYLENTPSLNWAAENGISFMTTLSERQWIHCFEAAGLTGVRAWRFNAKDDWAGTLVLTGQKPS